jgi:hypothetical protein
MKGGEAAGGRSGMEGGEAFGRICCWGLERADGSLGERGGGGSACSGETACWQTALTSGEGGADGGGVRAGCDGELGVPSSHSNCVRPPVHHASEHRCHTRCGGRSTGPHACNWRPEACVFFLPAVLTALVKTAPRAHHTEAGRG